MSRIVVVLLVCSLLWGAVGAQQQREGVVCSFDGPDFSIHELELTDFVVESAADPIRAGDELRVSFVLRNVDSDPFVFSDEGVFVSTEGPEGDGVFGRTARQRQLAEGENVTVDTEITVSAGTWTLWPAYRGARGQESPDLWQACTVAVESRTPTETPTLTIDDFTTDGQVAQGDVTISGTSNREDGTVVFIEVLGENGNVAASTETEVDDLTDSWEATLDLSDVETGTYTLHADDDASSAELEFELVEEVSTSTDTSTDTPTDTPTDTSTDTSTDTPTDTPTPTPPNVSISFAPTQPTIDEPATFEASVTNLSGDGPVTYEWDFDGDQNSDRTGPIVTYEFTTPGRTNVTLTVERGGETIGSSEAIVTVRRSISLFTRVVVATVGVLVLVLTVQIAIEDPGIETERDRRSRSGDLVIDRIHVLSPDGSRDPSRESVVFRNVGDAGFDLSGVRVRGDRDHEYTFDWGVEIEPDASLTLVTGRVPVTPGVVSWGRDHPVWSTDVTRLTVVDIDGVPLLELDVTELATEHGDDGTGTGLGSEVDER